MVGDGAAAPGRQDAGEHPDDDGRDRAHGDHRDGVLQVGQQVADRLLWVNDTPMFPWKSSLR
jgi:hypothetical protein